LNGKNISIAFVNSNALGILFGKLVKKERICCVYCWKTFKNANYKAILKDRAVGES